MSSITWPDLPARQQPEWPDQDALALVLADLRAQPPLVFAGECDTLTEQLGEAALGNAFVLTGGDCAETFAANTADSIRARTAQPWACIRSNVPGALSVRIVATPAARFTGLPL